MHDTALSEAALATALHEIEDQGYTVLENVIGDDLLDELSEELLRIEQDQDIAPSPNEFEGHQTVRIYNLLAYGSPFSKIPIHPAVLPVIEGVLDDAHEVRLDHEGIDSHDPATARILERVESRRGMRRHAASCRPDPDRPLLLRGCEGRNARRARYLQ